MTGPAASCSARGQIARFEQDGTLVDGVKVDGAEPGRLLVTDNGTIVASGGFALDDNLAQVLELEARGESVAATSDGGFVFGTARDTGGGTAGSGVTLRKVDASGALQWRSFASPAPGIHGMMTVLCSRAALSRWRPGATRPSSA